MQNEALTSFEERYRDCWNRFALGTNVDPAANTYEIFLLDLRDKAAREVAGSSPKPDGAIAKLDEAAT